MSYASPGFMPHQELCLTRSCASTRSESMVCVTFAWCTLGRCVTLGWCTLAASGMVHTGLGPSVWDGVHWAVGVRPGWCTLGLGGVHWAVPALKSLMHSSFCPSVHHSPAWGGSQCAPSSRPSLHQSWSQCTPCVRVACAQCTPPFFRTRSHCTPSVPPPVLLCCRLSRVPTRSPVYTSALAQPTS